LGKSVAVSFEGDRVKILHASLRGKTLSVKKTDIVSDDEFDHYLQRERSAEFIVTCNFRESYHDVLILPSLKSKYLRKIVESEIRKSASRKDFSFIYTPLGERVIENKKMLEVFYFAVSDEEIRNVVERFHRKGKIVRALYPSVCSAVSLIDAGESGDSNMGVLGIEKERIVFLSKNGSVHFIRNYDAIDEKLADFDIQNINMTINYCFQNLRMNPSSVVLMGDLSGSSDINMLPTVPLSSLCKTDHIKCSVEQFNDFILPVASLYATRTSNILSKDLRNMYALRTYMSHASKVFIIMAILCSGVIMHIAGDIGETKDSIELARKNIRDINNITSVYRSREETLRQYRQAVAFINRETPDMQELLIALAELDVQGLQFTSIDANIREGDSFFVRVQGISFVDTYSSLQSLVEYLIDRLGKTEGVRIKDNEIDMANKTFKIELEYR